MKRSSRIELSVVLAVAAVTLSGCRSSDPCDDPREDDEECREESSSSHSTYRGSHYRTGGNLRPTTTTRRGIFGGIGRVFSFGS